MFQVNGKKKLKLLFVVTVDILKREYFIIDNQHLVFQKAITEIHGLDEQNILNAKLDEHIVDFSRFLKINL